MRTNDLPTNHASQAARRRAGFTMLEITIVIILLVLFAAAAVPRMVGQQSREFQRTCDQIADMLMMYAKRESISTSAIGLRYLESEHRLEVVVYDELHRPGYPVESVWRSDRHIRPVNMPDFAEFVVFRASGEVFDITEWPYVSPPGEQRPMLELIVRHSEGMKTFVLPSYSVVPLTFDEDERISNVHQQINLDDAGRSREDW